MIKNNKKNAITAGIVLASATLTGCATNNIDDAQEEARNKFDEAELLKKQAEQLTRSMSSVDVVDEFYIVSQSHELSAYDRLPDFFSEQVTISQFNPITIQEIMSIVSQETNTRVEFSYDAMEFLSSGELAGETSETEEEDEEEATKEGNVATEIDFSGTKMHAIDQMFSVNYTGTLSGLLDHITNKAGLYWKWEDNQIVVFRMEVKHYTFDGVNSTTDFTSEVTAGGSAGDEAGGSRSTNHATGYSIEFAPVFSEIEAALESMVTEGGTWSVSTNTGSITVYDTPIVQKRVKKYIDRMNAIVNKRVMIKTQVLEVRSDDVGNYGIDWNAAYSGSGDYGFSLSSLAATGEPTGNLSFGILEGSGSNWAGTNSAVNALSQVADTSLVTSSTSMTQNGQPVPVQIVDSVGYLESLELIPGDDDSDDEYQMNTEQIESGFSMSILPRITSDGSVSMQMAVDLSELNGFDTFEFGGNAAMTPDVSRKNFMQNVNIRSGQTLLLSGFERTIDESTTESMFGENSWLFGGSKEGGKRKVMTVILMTPYIMSK